MSDHISEGDIIQHVIKIGVDTAPAISRSSMRTRLNAFAEEALLRWPDMYQTLTSGDSFSISHEVRSAADRSVTARGPSFVLVDRGPVFVFPLVIPDLNKTNIADHWQQWFQEVLPFFFNKFSELKIVRLGMVRELIFATSQMNCLSVLRAAGEISGGPLAQGQVNFEYQTGDYNIIVFLAPTMITKTLTLPAGPTISKEQDHGLIVKLDVNNRFFRELGGTDIEGILETAASLWPTRLLDYVNGRFD